MINENCNEKCRALIRAYRLDFSSPFHSRTIYVQYEYNMLLPLVRVQYSAMWCSALFSLLVMNIEFSGIVCIVLYWLEFEVSSL